MNISVRDIPMITPKIDFIFMRTNGRIAVYGRSTGPKSTWKIKKGSQYTRTIKVYCEGFAMQTGSITFSILFHFYDSHEPICELPCRY